MNNEKLLSQNLLKQKVFTDMMTKHNELYRWWKKADLITAILSVVGLLLALIEYEIGYKIFEGDRHNISIEREAIRLLVFILSISSLITIIIRYYFKRKWQNLPVPKEVRNQVYNNDYTNLMRQNRRKRFISIKLILDSVICIICPIPFYETDINISQYVHDEREPVSANYLLSDLILIFMFTRIYLVLRNAFNHTEFSDPYAKLH